jgi:hypothetical protein
MPQTGAGACLLADATNGAASARSPMPPQLGHSAGSSLALIEAQASNDPQLVQS